jgi:predicted SPOUT superfamily RNA methylase MTH1
MCTSSIGRIKAEKELERKLCVAIPASVVSDTPHLREKTSKIGLIGRAASIFKVSEIIIYPDNPKTNQTLETGLVATLLSYMETPQYLRKRLFKLKPELRYAGILPPLRTLHHPLNRKTKNLKVGEYREGVTLSKTREGALIDIGVEQPALARNVQSDLGTRVTVKIIEIGKQAEVQLVNREDVPVYWGYALTVTREPFGSFVKSRAFDLTIATSKYGSPFGDLVHEIAKKWESAKTG